MPFSRRTLIYGAAALCGGALFGGGYAIGSYTETISATRARIDQKSRLVPTRFGDLEYAVEGRGKPILMIHGTGGGFDQGLRFASGLISSGFEVIAPSRFGYLRSDFPSHPTSENQADAFVDLLDALQIDKIPVAGGSAGALSAAQFALRHPDRCSHLVLIVPAMNLSNRDPVEFTRLQRYFVGKLLTSDRWFWAALKLAPDQLIRTLLATDPALLDKVETSERNRARLILGDLMPISQRATGMANDARLAGRPSDIDFSLLQLPTLVVSAQDDLFGTAQTARTISERTPKARLEIFPSGGHIWLGHDNELTDLITEFVASG
jgi:pimeloyl-ACP methyl ester carboxylesterase